MAPRDFRPLGRRRARRARELAGRYEASAEALHFAAEVAGFQSEIADRVRDWEELPALRGALVKMLAGAAPARLRESVLRLDDRSFRNSLEQYWSREDTASPGTLGARVVLQPYAFQQSSKHGNSLPGRQPDHCPACRHAPQAGVLRPAGHGSALSLVCSLCLTEYAVTRGHCNSCQKGGRGVLDFYSSEELPHIQVQACRFCKTYLHVVDLEKEPQAVPDIDELTALPLDVWAREKGYSKEQLNLVGI